VPAPVSGPDGDRQPDLGGGRPDRVVDGVAVRDPRGARQEHRCEPAGRRHPPDLRRGGLGPLRRHHQRAVEARLVPQPAVDQPVVVGGREPGGQARVRQHGEARRLVRVGDRERDVERVEHVLAQLLEREAGEHRAGLDRRGVVGVAADPAGRVDPRVRRHREPRDTGALDQLARMRVGVRHELPERAVRDVDVAVDEHSLTA
jgi:hypothetical protein